MLAAEMDGMAAAEKLQGEGRDGNHSRLQIGQRLAEAGRVRRLCQMAKSVSRLNSAAP